MKHSTTQYLSMKSRNHSLGKKLLLPNNVVAAVAALNKYSHFKCVVQLLTVAYSKHIK